MAHLEQYVVETPTGEKFKIFAANAFDAGKQVIKKITFKNTLVHHDTIVQHGKSDLPE